MRADGAYIVDADADACASLLVSHAGRTPTL